MIQDSAAVVRRDIDQFIQRNRIPGIQYTVVDADGIRFEHQSGYADLASSRLVSPETTFMASSSTKVITAAAVLQLAERQKLELDKPLSTYYSNHSYTEKVTIRHLLTQTAGMPNPLPLKWLHRADGHDRFNEERALQQTLQHHSKLTSSPGEKYGYSNISYWLLGKAVESASGRSFSEYVREQIFEPLEIPPSAASFQIENPVVHATGYQRSLSLQGLILYLLMDRRLLGKTVKGYRSLLPVYMNGPAYGGLICTATAFGLFLQALLRPTPRLFSAQTRELMFKHQVTAAGNETGMSLGWRIGHTQKEPYYGKPGGGPGFRSNVRLYPRLGLGVAWLANETGVSETQMNSLSDTIDRHWFSSWR